MLFHLLNVGKLFFWLLGDLPHFSLKWYLASAKSSLALGPLFMNPSLQLVELDGKFFFFPVFMLKLLPSIPDLSRILVLL